VQLYYAYINFKNGQCLAALAAYQDAAKRATIAGLKIDRSLAHFNIAQCYRVLGDFRAARAHFGKAASGGSPALRARAMRCVARMSIRMHGPRSIVEMNRAKESFVLLGMAGEICRCTLAIMEELIRFDPTINLSTFRDQLREEIAFLGLMPAAAEAVTLLNRALDSGSVAEPDLQAIWNVFGPNYAASWVSGMETVRN